MVKYEKGDLKLLKKLLPILLILIMVIMSGCKEQKKLNQLEQIIERDKLIVGVKTDSKPFGYIDSGTLEIIGFDIDIARRVAKDLLGSETKVKFVPVTPENRIETLTSGQADIIIATMSVTKAREEVVDFSEPYFIAGESAAVLNNGKIQSYADLNQKRVLVVLGTTAAGNIKNNIPGSLIVGYKNYDEMFDALKSNRGDAAVTDDAILSGFVMDNPDYKLLNPRLTIEPYGIGLRKGDNSASLKNAVNRTISAMKSDGTINSLKQKWGIN